MRWSPDPRPAGGERAGRTAGGGVGCLARPRRAHPQPHPRQRQNPATRGVFAPCVALVSSADRDPAGINRPFPAWKRTRNRLASAAPALHYPTPAGARRGRDERARLKEWHAFLARMHQRNAWLSRAQAVIRPADRVLPSLARVRAGEDTVYVGAAPLRAGSRDPAAAKARGGYPASRRCPGSRGRNAWPAIGSRPHQERDSFKATVSETAAGGLTFPRHRAPTLCTRACVGEGGCDTGPARSAPMLSSAATPLAPSGDRAP
jgi:hypothetical protein